MPKVTIWVRNWLGIQDPKDWAQDFKNLVAELEETDEWIKSND